MRFDIIIFCLGLYGGCATNENIDPQVATDTGFWITQSLEYYDLDFRLGGGKTSYGGGYLLRLDSNGVCKSLSGDYYWENDSLYKGGEPGSTIKQGSWKKHDGFIILNQKLLSKTFMLPGIKIGDITVDSLHDVQKGVLKYGADRLISSKNVSHELKQIFDGIQ